MSRILSFGEIIWDVYPDKSIIGGAPLNFSAHSVLCGAEAYLISAVGNDKLGTEALAKLKIFGIPQDFIQINNFETGKCTVSLDENGVPDFNVAESAAYDNIENIDFSKINSMQFDAFYFGTLIGRSPKSRATLKNILNKCKFKNIICDINLRKNCYEKETVLLCLNNATVLKLSIDEEKDLRKFGFYDVKNEDFSEIAKAICKRFSNIEILIVTLGEKGSIAYNSKTSEIFVQNAVKVPVISTVGAGDSFAAAFTVSLLNGESMQECMEKANKISGYVVSCADAVPIYKKEDLF